MKKLIIAEKPSQAQEYAKALGQFNKKDGYLENQIYFITWCYGHMISLEKDDAYREVGKWNKSYLPLIPLKFKYKIGTDSKGKTDSGKKKQIGVIENLIKQSSEIINATDADREGELIFLYVYNYLNCKLPFKRLWISSLTKTDILKGFDNLLNASDVFHLGKSAYARAIADWLVGINGTQASTLQFGNGKLLTIGRVQTAILKIICERYLKNKNFKSSFTYKLKADHFQNENFYSETNVFETKTEAENILKSLSNKHTCIEVEKKISNEQSPLLFSIDTLIIEANKSFKYSGQETLAIAQTLYEKKVTSYPRTDSTYINDENFNNLKLFLPSFAEDFLKMPFSFSQSKPKSVNDKKLTGSHDAIVPTGEIVSNLSEKETNIFKLIISRCLQSFSEAAQYEKIKYVFNNNNTIFNTYNSKLINIGWKKYLLSSNLNELNQDSQQQSLDLKIAVADIIDVVQFSVKEVESKPPALYSEVNLTSDLTNFGKLLKEESPELIAKIKSNIDINSLQIGTQATRPGIIERLKHLGFIELKKNKFIPTDDGLKYYEVFKDLKVSDVVTTAIWEMKLKKVAEASEDIKEFYKEITDFTKEIVSDIFDKDIKVVFSNAIKENLGKCPKCKKGDVYENKMAFGCSEFKNGCDFSIWKTLASKKLSKNNVKVLLSKKVTPKIKGFKGKTGKSFDASIKINDQNKVEFKF